MDPIYKKELNNGAAEAVQKFFHVHTSVLLEYGPALSEQTEVFSCVVC